MAEGQGAAQVDRICRGIIADPDRWPSTLRPSSLLPLIKQQPPPTDTWDFCFTYLFKNGIQCNNSIQASRLVLVCRKYYASGRFKRERAGRQKRRVTFCTIREAHCCSGKDKEARSHSCQICAFRPRLHLCVEQTYTFRDNSPGIMVISILKSSRAQLGYFVAISKEGPLYGSIKYLRNSRASMKVRFIESYRSKTVL